jgi:MFS family permease
MLAPVLGGLIAGIAGWRSAYTLLAIPAMLTVPFLIQEARRTEAVTNKATASATTATPSVMRAMHPILFVFALAVLTQLVVGSVVSFLPIYWVDKHAIAPAAAATLIGLERGGRILGSLLGGTVSDRWGRKQGILLSVISVGPLIVLIILLPFGGLLLATLALFGVMVAMRQPAVQSLIVDTIPERRTSTMLGVYFFLALEGRSLMIPLLGYLMDIFGVGNVLMYLAIAAAALSTAGFVLRKKV